MRVLVPKRKLITTDDVCLENLHYWLYWDMLKECYPWLKVLAFVIANYKYAEKIAESKDFFEWRERTKDWVDIGVHGYDHLDPPEQERNDAEELVIKSLEILAPFLPEEVIYRPPGHQRSIHTESMLQRLGFAGIAYQTSIRYFDGRRITAVYNSHCGDQFDNPVNVIWRKETENEGDFYRSTLL